MQQRRVLHDHGVGLGDGVVRADRLVVDAAERHHRRAGALGAEARERLRVPALVECRHREHLGGGDRALTTSAVDPHLEHQRGRAGLGYFSRMFRSALANRSDSSCSRCQTLRPKISPVAPASIDSRAFSSMASSPALLPPEISTRERLADRTTASIASWLVNSPVVRRRDVGGLLRVREVQLDHVGAKLAGGAGGVVDGVEGVLAALGLDRPTRAGRPRR